MKPEESIQIQICRWMDRQGYFYHSIPNEAEGRSKLATIRLIQMGLRKGVADMAIWLRNGKIAYMEVKSKTGKQSEAQKSFETLCKSQGFPYRVVRSLEEAQEYLGSLSIEPTFDRTMGELTWN